MTRSQVLPTILMVIDMGAGVVCGLDGDWRKLVYWWAAAVLTASVTW